jgi:3-deoxy-manno-octulosonate cytidylyltransferase (CMP-KDO synthetase)
MPHVLGVIPARYASTRFPGKPLAPLGDRTLIEVVWRAARRSERLDRVIIATDDRRIADEATRIGAESMMTSVDHPTGTDRVAEVIQSLDEVYDIAINIQGDEPLLTPTSIDRVVEVFDRTPAPDMATLAEPIVSIEELFDPNAVKLVTDARGRALYFSRSPIPFHRGSLSELQIDFRESLVERSDGLDGFRKHPGIYAYSREILLALTRLEPSRLELDEDLEQLRALEAGYVIQVVDSDFCSFPVDTPADLERAAKLVTEAN